MSEKQGSSNELNPLQKGAISVYNALPSYFALEGGLLAKHAIDTAEEHGTACKYLFGYGGVALNISSIPLIAAAKDVASESNFGEELAENIKSEDQATFRGQNGYLQSLITLGTGFSAYQVTDSHLAAIATSVGTAALIGATDFLRDQTSNYVQASKEELQDLKSIRQSVQPNSSFSERLSSERVGSQAVSR